MRAPNGGVSSLLPKSLSTASAVSCLLAKSTVNRYCCQKKDRNKEEEEEEYNIVSSAIGWMNFLLSSSLSSAHFACFSPYLSVVFDLAAIINQLWLHLCSSWTFAISDQKRCVIYGNEARWVFPSIWQMMPHNDVASAIHFSSEKHKKSSASSKDIINSKNTHTPRHTHSKLFLDAFRFCLKVIRCCRCCCCCCYINELSSLRPRSGV